MKRDITAKKIWLSLDPHRSLSRGYQKRMLRSGFSLIRRGWIP